jgi:hypothetical protein
MERKRRQAARSETVRKEVQRKTILRKTIKRRNIRRYRRDEIWPAFVIGLDLGQERDPSAIAIIEQVLPSPSEAAEGGLPELEYHVRHLERFELGTEYPVIADAVVALMNDPILLERTILVVDATGVGAGVVGLLHRHGLRPAAITITGGDSVSRSRRGWRVPKRDIVSVLQVLFQTRRVKIAPELDLSDDLFEELLNFTARINSRMTKTFSPLKNDQHDDLVIALALPCHFLERLRPRLGIVQAKVIG